MTKFFFPVNIGQFNEPSYISEDGTLDIDQIMSDYEASQQQETDDQVLEQEPEQDLDEGQEELDPEDIVPSGEEEQQILTTQEQDQEKNQKRTPDQAFAEMRRKIEQYEPLAQWVQDLAVQQGYQDPTELMKAYEDYKMEQEAKSQGIPVDVYKRLHELETENKRAKEEALATKFNSEVEKTIQKYNLNDDQLQQVFEYMARNGYNAGDIPFEDAYILANKDRLIQEAEERGKQKYLESLQKKQKQATPNIKGSPTDTPKGDTDLDYSKEGIFKMFKELDIDID